MYKHCEEGASAAVPRAQYRRGILHGEGAGAAAPRAQHCRD